MAKLLFRVEADYQKVIKLREEIAKLKQDLSQMNTPMQTKILENQLAGSQKELEGLVMSAAKAGLALDNNLKKKIYSTSQGVNDFTEKIIKQKSVVKDVEGDVKKLANAYRDAVKNNPMQANGILSNLTAARKALDEEKASLFGLTQQQAEARLSVKRLKDEYNLYNKETQNITASNDLIGASLKKAFVVAGGTYALKELASNIVRVRGEFQEMETSIRTLVGEEMANKLIPQVRELAKVSPLTMSDMVGAEKMMLGFNIEAEKTIGFLSAMSDISMGNSQKFNSLTLAFSQMSAAGKLIGQDLNQMISAGFNPLQIMSEKTGKSIAQLKDEMSKGAISAEMVQKAFMDATSAGGKFYNMSANASKEINGQISMMEDAMDAASNKLGTQLQGLIMGGVKGTTALIQNYETIGKVIAGLIATYGAYRTAVMLVTVAESKHTLVEIGLTNVRILARKAQLALNASMLTNPYVALAVVVGGLVTAMWAMSDSTSASEKAQKKYNKAKEEATQKEKDHKAKIEELIDIARDESLATLTREHSLEILKKAYPKIFEKYDIEKLKLEDILKLKKQINEEDSLRAQVKQKDDYSSLQSLTKRQQRYSDLYYNDDLRKNMSQSDKDIWKEFSGTPIVKIKESLAKNYETLKLSEKDLLADNLASYKVQISKFSKDKVNAELKALEEARKTGKRATINGISMAGRRLDSYIGVLKEEQGKKVETSTYQKDYDKAKKEWDDAKKKLSEIEKDKERFTSKQYDEAKKLSESKEKAYKDLGGDIKDYTKEEEAANRKKDAVEKKRLKEDQKNHDDYISLVRSNQQDTIDLMDEGSEKTIKKIELDYQKTTDAIRKQEREWSKNGITDEQSVQIFLAYTNAEDKRDKETQNYYKSLLDKYKGYLEQRKTLNEQYDRDKDNLVKAGASQAYIEELELQRTKALEDIDSTFAMRDEEFQQWANSISNMALEKLQEMLRKAKAALAEMEKENPNDSNLASARAKVNELEDEIEKENISTDPDKESFKKWQQLYSTLQKVSGQFKELGKDIGGAAGESISAVGEIATSTISIISSIKSFSQISSKSIEGVSDSAAKSIKAVEKASVILAIIGAALQLMQQINSLLPTAENEYDKYAEKVKEINKLTDAVNQYKIAALEAQQAESKWFSGDSLKNLRDYKELHDAIAEEYTTKRDESQAIYQNKGGGGWSTNFWNTLLDSTYGKIYGVNFGRQYEKGTTAAINNLRIETRKKSNGFLGSGIGGKSQKTEDLQAWINSNKNLFKGLDTDLFDKEGLLNNELAKAIVDKYGDKLVGQTKETLEALIKIREQYDEYLNQLHEYVSSLYEPLVDNVVASLWDWLDNGKDALDSFKEYAGDTFRDIVSDMLKTIVIDKVIGTFSKDISDMYDKYATGKLTEEELAAEVAKRTQGLVDSYETALPTMENILTNINENFKKAGIDLTNTSSSQNSTSKGYSTTSQETSEEISGRLTADVEANEQSRAQLVLQTQIITALQKDVEIILDSGKSMKDIVDEIRDIVAKAYLELIEIRENTGNSAKYLKDIKDDIAEVKNNTKKL